MVIIWTTRGGSQILSWWWYCGGPPLMNLRAVSCHLVIQSLWAVLQVISKWPNFWQYAQYLFIAGQHIIFAW